MRFHPALGDPEGLHERERGLFSSESFAALPAAHPSVQGQPFWEYLRAAPPWPTPQKDTLYLRAIGPNVAPEPEMTLWAEWLRAYLGMPVARMRPLDAHVSAATRGTPAPTGCGGLLAEDLVQRLCDSLPDDAFAVVALCAIDLYPEATYTVVYGSTRAAPRVTVYAFLHCDTDDEETRLRQVRRQRAHALAHQACHLLGIAHCPYFVCAMNVHPAGEEEGLVREGSEGLPLTLCPVCLRKLAYALGFDVRARYQALSGMLDTMGFAEDAAWVRGRLAGTPGAFPLEWSP